MLPLVLLQLMYKSTWLLTIGLPAYLAGTMNEIGQGLVFVCAVGVVLDLLIVPWSYVFRVYVMPTRSVASSVSNSA